MTGVIEFHGVCKSFTRGFAGSKGSVVPAAEGIDLTVGPHEAVGVMGANGAGKTTLLRLAAGITNPDSGIVRRRGRVVPLIELGAGFHPDLTGAENIGLAGSLFGLTRQEIIDRREEIVDFSGLGNSIHRPVKHYSSGMLARLGFAIGVCADPDILLIDEVLAVGDLEFQQRCIQAVDRLLESGSTVVVVTHDPALVGASCDRVIVMSNGSVVDDGPTAAVVGRYLRGDADRSESMSPRRADAALTTPTPLIEPEEPLALSLELNWPPGAPIVTRLEFAVAVHPAASLEGREGVATFSGTPLTLGEAPGGRVRFDLHARVAGIPPGRFLAVITLDDGEPTPLRLECGFRVRGTPPAVPVGTLPVEWSAPSLSPVSDEPGSTVR